MNSTAIFHPQHLPTVIAQTTSNTPSLAPWLIVGLIVLVLCLCFIGKVRYVLFKLLRAALVVLLVCTTLFVVYLLCFDHCASVPKYVNGREVLLFGVVESVRVSPKGDGKRASFMLSDPTGRLRVVTTSGPPAEGAVAFIRGRKGTYDGEAAFVECGFRLSSF